jgi:hypothetical protein
MYHLIAAAQQATHLAITPQQARTAGLIGFAIIVLIIVSKIWNALFGNGR